MFIWNFFLRKQSYTLSLPQWRAVSHLSMGSYRGWFKGLRFVPEAEPPSEILVTTQGLGNGLKKELVGCRRQDVAVLHSCAQNKGAQRMCRGTMPSLCHPCPAMPAQCQMFWVLQGCGLSTFWSKVIMIPQMNQQPALWDGGFSSLLQRNSLD